MSAQVDVSTLAELQRDFQRHVMHGHERIVDAVGGSPRVPATVRLAVYSQAYRLRLTDALASTLPCLQQLMGKDQFAAIASDYIDLSPSTYASIRWFGDQLPLLLRRSFPEQPWLAELASWEWAIAAAFDGADAAPIGVEALATVAPDQWPTLQFQFHPTVQCLQMRTNAPV
ncbi:MAG: DNA-binding domain-containing protein, partial [Pseudomonadota bacterium]|nr:DNA-binding domain-containing protein [Pseudomonadota bacterium]